MEISYSKNSKGIIKHLKTCKRYMDNKTHLKIYLGSKDRSKSVSYDQNPSYRATFRDICKTFMDI